jgi:hypothetical protein
MLTFTAEDGKEDGEKAGIGVDRWIEGVS